MEVCVLTPEQVVQKQLEFYNQNDLDGFASTYNDEIEIYDLPEGTLRYKGIEELKSRYAVSFKLNTRARIASRIVEGNKVIDHEYFIRDGMEKEGSVVAIYEVTGNQISKVWFLKG